MFNIAGKMRDELTIIPKMTARHMRVQFFLNFLICEQAANESSHITISNYSAFYISWSVISVFFCISQLYLE
jgi:hypothetical protein